MVMWFEIICFNRIHKVKHCNSPIVFYVDLGGCSEIRLMAWQQRNFRTLSDCSGWNDLRFWALLDFNESETCTFANWISHCVWEPVPNSHFDIIGNPWVSAVHLRNFAHATGLGTPPQVWSGWGVSWPESRAWISSSLCARDAWIIGHWLPFWNFRVRFETGCWPHCSNGCLDLTGCQSVSWFGSSDLSGFWSPWGMLIRTFDFTLGLVCSATRCWQQRSNTRLGF